MSGRGFGLVDQDEVAVWYRDGYAQGRETMGQPKVLPREWEGESDEDSRISGPF